MMKIRFDRAAGLGAAMLLAFAMPAGAANSTSNSSVRPSQEAAQQQVDEAESQRRICVRLQQGGSRITRPVCKTAQEWETAGGIPDPDR